MCDYIPVIKLMEPLEAKLLSVFLKGKCWGFPFDLASSAILETPVVLRGNIWVN